MAHLNFFGVENFKVFADLHRFDLKPITILTGTNSSGKSSLTKAILLLKEGFEKVSFKSGETLHAWSINDIFFQNNLNLGNFDTCVNRGSNSEILTFELPFRFPLIEDQFIIKLSYEKTKNAVKNAMLDEVQITHRTSNDLILSHSNKTGDLKINFSFLRNKFDAVIGKVRAVHKLEDEIVVLEKPFRKEIERFKFDNEEINEHDELNQTTVLEPDSIPEEVRIKIENLKTQQKAVLPTYRIYNDNIDEDAFNSHRGIYNLNLHTHVMYNELRPLLNYMFLFDLDKVGQKLEELKLSQEEFDELKIISADIKNKLLKKTTDLNNHLIELELSVLNDLTSNSFQRYPLYEDLKYFSSSISILSSVFELRNNLTSGLRSAEPVFADYLWSFNDETCGLLLNPIENILTDNLKYFSKDFIHDGIGTMMNTISNIYKSMSYVPSVRSKIDRVFRNNSDSYLQEVLFQLHQVNIYDESREFINKYLQIFKIADSIEIVLSEDSSFTKIYFLKGDTKYELADIGYGISQVLPIVLKIALKITELVPMPEYGRYFYESSIIIIEEPETNLHPALQSKLADMFVECYEKYNIQFIIEIHSEYLVRKLQYLTAKKQFAAKDSVIYYFHDPNNVPKGEKQVKRIDILEDGSLSDDFGTGFFDEAANWELELLRLKNNKARQN